METKKRAFGSPLLAMVGVLIIVVALFAYFYSASSGTESSLNSQFSSLATASSSEAGVIAAQSSQLQSLQSSGHSRTTTVTSTVVSNLTVTETTTVASGGGPATVTTTVTSTKFSTQTVTQTVGAADVATVTGSLNFISGQNGSATLTISVMNGGYDTITGVSVSIPTGSDPTLDLCSSSCSLQVLYNSVPITSTAPLSGGQTGSGINQTDEGQAGSTYGITVGITFGDGTQQSITAEITGQGS